MSDNESIDKKDSDDKDDKKILSSVFKKVLSTGITAAFMTEDAVKNIISDLPLPKDIANGLLQNAKSSKDEFISGVKNELKGYLDKIDLSKEIDKIIEKYDIEINAKINLNKKDKVKEKSKAKDKTQD